MVARLITAAPTPPPSLGARKRHLGQSAHAPAVRQLTWREGRPEDKPRLASFCCARTQRRGKRPIFPFPYEKQVQSEVRRVKPSCDTRSAVLLGEHPDTGEILSVVSVRKWDEPDAYLIEMIAVDIKAKGQRIGDQAMYEALQWIENHADAAGLTAVVVLADCDPKNKRARALLRRSRFTSIGAEGRREQWFYDFSFSF